MASIFNMAVPDQYRAGIATAVGILEAGRLVAMPTETVYGLAADAGNPLAVASIYAVKRRPRFNPLIVHIAGSAMAEELAYFDNRARRLADRFWPGPLTLVLNQSAGGSIADLALAGLSTVALRQPDHPVPAALLRHLGRPVVAPSANRSGRLSPTTAAHVARDLGDDVDCILDAGPTDVGVESTIVDLSGNTPLLLRPGGLARADIEAVLGRPLATPDPVATRPTAPGQLASHYAPRATLRLEATTLQPGEALLAFGPVPTDMIVQAVAVENLSPAGDLVEAATRFFGALHTLDGLAERIAVMPIPETGLGEALNDRLRRGAAPRG